MEFNRRRFFLPLLAISASLALSKVNKPEKKPQFDKEGVYQQFLGIESLKLHKSREIGNYPQLLRQKPDGKDLISGIQADATFHDYPCLGELPAIDESGLDFLHLDIEEACVCLGSFTEGQFKTKWLGRNSLRHQEFWSATKLVPLLNILCKGNLQEPETDISNCLIRGVDQDNQVRNIVFRDLAEDIMTYQECIASSNSLSATLKRFQPQIELETWFQSLTGNSNLVFRGRYGEDPLITVPELYNPVSGTTILQGDRQEVTWGENNVSAYDLTRLISFIGWHHYLTPSARIPAVNQSSLNALIKVMGLDTARFGDLALNMLGLDQQLDSLVILSKEGHGTTKIRNRTEKVYVALIQFVKNNQLVTLAITLKGAIATQPRDLKQEAIQLNARLATEVTEIIWRNWEMRSPVL
ncbi:hypothetical protein [Gloeocapsa sp. PCC 73106]|uniref:hypothetical protein n=1 Tax=Gloeocapsa sp. PCC 73106 TaxID=102232 RepID=UPI0002AC8EB8|nr:hypothetical protein [Gloeocapsa sp. PCC 73106]ELR96499.1 hypothetical protein GLO73106DRAFT_00002930 [Gloeocapsa sp. PCC 73106]